MLLSVGLTACGEDRQATSPTSAASGDPGPVHVHGLGVDPADGALLIATHTGLYRAPAGESTATRVGERSQDTMGFTVVGPRRYLGSGHPDPRDDLPPFLGLIESRDGGRTWRSISLLGKRDFHVLEAVGDNVYGYGSDFETQAAGLLVSEDGGRRWRERATPEPLVSLAVDRAAPQQLVASGQRRLHLSRDGGRTWRVFDGPPGLVALRPGSGPLPRRLLVVTGDGVVWRLGTSWASVGEIGGEPAALDDGVDGELLVALHDGTIKRSGDDGVSWEIRVTP